MELKDDGSGVFKPKSGEIGGAKERGTGYKRERAAYLVNLFLEFDLVPPTVVRRIEGKIGSVQQFIPDSRCWDYLTFGENEELFDKIQKQQKLLWLFDFIIANHDRNGGNYLVDKDDKLWAIDHGDTFHNRCFLPDLVVDHTYEPGVVAKIKSLAESKNRKELLRKLLLELLSREEVESCIKRLELLADRFEDNRITNLKQEQINKITFYAQS